MSQPIPAVAGSQERFTLCCGGATPVPVRFSAAELAAELASESVAAAVPEARGTKVNVNGALCPAAIVTGNAIPLSENSESVTLAEETVTLDPLATSVAD